MTHTVSTVTVNVERQTVYRPSLTDHYAGLYFGSLGDTLVWFGPADDRTEQVEAIDRLVEELQDLRTSVLAKAAAA